MSKIIIGTTPTIKYTFRSVDVATIVTAILTIKKNGVIVLRKELSDATVGENDISWKLTQADTLGIGKDVAKMMVNWLTLDGTRGASVEMDVVMRDNHIPEVIS